MMSLFTRKVIIQSFLKILEKKNFDKITVKDIIEESNVSRSTFYYHFADIYELAQAAFEEECQQILTDDFKDRPWQEVLIEATQVAKESRKSLYHAFNTIDRERLEIYLFSVTKSIMKVYVDKVSEPLQVSDEEKEFIITCYVCALVGMIMRWITEGMKEDAEVFIKKMSDLFSGSLYSMLEKSSHLDKK